ncbi:hypothetical protein CVD28_12130 [Bacillus sp. M6-12]|uniref:hypothetical protein n=1 Tax=Bacillus sp. M6-12 TaxID=2054166 RepID=UPI000C76846B|nr:hypothetical protein [Bacillus sp. M6-12]PLS17311.1 hypothetical protein CVD28_12130 [Bacillus sp. M6-12]
MISRELIEKIVFEVLTKMNVAESAENFLHSKPNLMVVKGDKEIDISSLKQLESKWNVLFTSASDPKEAVHAVLFLNADQDLLVKGALGIADTSQSSLLAKYLLKGSEVTLIPDTLLENAILADDQITKNAYAAQLLEYKERLQTYGVKIESLTNFLESAGQNLKQPEQALSFEGKLLSQKEVQASTEQDIKISAKTIVTPLARDTARDLGKTISVID